MEEALGEHVEGDELADRQLTIHHQMRAIPQRGGIHQLANQVDAFMGDAGQVLGSKARGNIPCQLVVPAFGKSRLQRAGFDGLDGGDGFHQHGLVFCATGEFGVQTAAQDGHHGQAQAKIQRQADQHDQGQRHAVEQHDGDEDDAEEDVQQHRQSIASQKGADVLQLAHAGHRVAHPASLEVGQRQLHQVAEQLGPQLDIDAAGGVAEDVSAQRVGRYWGQIAIFLRSTRRVGVQPRKFGL